jgi:hypothetical protein
MDDAKLEQLAARRPKDLFPILERSASLSPLLVVLTFLPGIVALESAQIDEMDAQWRLKSLELATAPTLADFIDPSGISGTDLRWQPPLGSWIAAGAVHLPGVVGAHGLELVDYLSAASLVPACFFLATRLFGRRIGFITALLVAVHTTFLEQHQNATPHGLAILTAIGAFWGFLGHLRHVDELVSVDLLVGGISLGLCLLAGGPLAFVVAAVLLVVALVNIEPLAEARRPGTARRGRFWSGWPAFRALGVLMATAFAAGGWWELMMLYSYGGQFLSGWLWGMPALPMRAQHVRLHVFSGAFALRFIREFFAMARILAGLTLLGLWTIGRGLLSRTTGTQRSSYLFLGTWFVGGLFFFTACLRLEQTGDPTPGSLYLNMWRLFLMSACTACSALALDEVARRRIDLPLFVSVTIGSLMVGFLFLHPPQMGEVSAALILAGGLAFAVFAAQVLRQVCQTSESREWVVLAGLIVAYVAADASIGISTIRADDVDWRALTTFHNSLPPQDETVSCLLISESKPPYRLLLALKSAWPTAKITLIPDWDQALKVALDEHQLPKTAIVVDWSHGNSRPANPTGAQWEADPVGNPQFFESRQLRAYVLKREHTPRDEERTARDDDRGVTDAGHGMREEKETRGVSLF